MKKGKFSFYYVFLVCSITVVGCKKDGKNPKDPHDHNEQENITTLRLEFKEAGTNNVATYQFRDIDGAGGNAPVIDSILLKKNTDYFVNTYLLDESQTPAEDLTAEIEKEKEEHIFVYSPSGVDINTLIIDKDKNNVAVGLLTIWKTGESSSGTVKVVLKHQPEVKDGNPARGETDIEVVFPTRIN